ncbi:DUF308 domain-containing protein [Sphingomonas sp.]|uniref:DUF308 domain-containing protein n=1 Tax=Sphingomonas sp. TaxID=28214 RepID=UPI000DB55963|nr:DUF308 domain-containing protein [Sphingomonas sp.]PZU10388.1 MAG: hypothetical protein DI605_05770 [Sphingomonas sp.]
MTSHTALSQIHGAPSVARWLKRYYAGRALFSAVWVAGAFTIGRANPAIGMALLIAYPAWDCIANCVDAARSGGLRANPSQFLNAVASAIVTLAIAVTAGHDLHIAIGVIGIWAALAGVLQLATGIRRWRSASAQWPQILSGAQSALAGTHFLFKAFDPALAVGVADVAPYAAFGALYFAISSAVLAFRR